jgi:hypothetical protein
VTRPAPRPPHPQFWQHWTHAIPWGGLATGLAAAAAVMSAFIAVRKYKGQSRQQRRAQAGQIEVRLRDDGPVPPGTLPREYQRTAGEKLYDENEDTCLIGVVSNSSDRPIRCTNCKIRIPGKGWCPAARVYEWITWNSSSGGGARHSLRNCLDRPDMELVKPHSETAFSFPFRREEHPDAKDLMVTFTDDNRRRWRIDPDLRLKRQRWWQR